MGTPAHPNLAPGGPGLLLGRAAGPSSAPYLSGKQKRGHRAGYERGHPTGKGGEGWGPRPRRASVSPGFSSDGGGHPKATRALPPPFIKKDKKYFFC